MMMLIKIKWKLLQVVSEQHSCELAVEEAEELKRFAHYLDLLFSVVGRCWLSKNNMNNTWSCVFQRKISSYYYVFS